MVRACLSDDIAGMAGANGPPLDLEARIESAHIKCSPSGIGLAVDIDVDPSESSCAGRRDFPNAHDTIRNQVSFNETRPHRPESTWAIVPGRMGSSRMLGKTMADLAGKPSLVH